MSLLGRVVNTNNKRGWQKMQRVIISVFYQKIRFASSLSDANIINSGLPDLNIPKISINEYVIQNIGNWEDRVATECALTGRKYTFQQLRKKSKNLSKSLRKKLKLQPGDVIAILLPNSPEYPIALLGALDSGLIITTLNPIYTPDEISRQLIDSNAKALITLTDFYKLGLSSIELTQKKLPILTIKSKENESTPPGAINFTEFTDNDCDISDINVDPSNIAFLPYSSGTTGLPKGVQLTHGNIVANLTQTHDDNIGIIRITTKDHQDIIPAVLPMFHIYGLTSITLNAASAGSKLVTLPKFTPELYVSMLKKQHPHLLYVAPPLAIFLGNHPSVTKDSLANVRTVMSGAAPLGALDIERLLKKAEKEIFILQGYGLTETSPFVACTRPAFLKDKKSQGSVGKPCANTFVKIVSVDDPSGPALPPNQPGEALIKGPQVMKGYHNRPEETKKTFTEDGWLRTGDMMYHSEEGYLFVTDRLKELIKVKGFQVPPAELEEIIRDFPQVEDAAVIGIPHQSHGEIPRAYVVPKKGTQLDVKKLTEFVNEKVANYKQIRGGIAVVESIPKNAAGKILRRQLKDQFINENK